MWVVVVKVVNYVTFGALVSFVSWMDAISGGIS